MSFARICFTNARKIYYHLRVSIAQFLITFTFIAQVYKMPVAPCSPTGRCKSEQDYFNQRLFSILKVFIL